MNPKRIQWPVAAGVGAALILSGIAITAVTQSSQAAPPPDRAFHGPGPDMGPGPGPMMPGFMPPGAFERIADRLQLSAEQRETARGFLEQAKPGLDKLRQQMHASAELLAKTRPDDPSYQSVVANASQTAGDLASQLVLQGSQVRSQVFGVLTADQKNKLVTIEAEMRARWSEHKDGHGHGRGGHPPGGPDGDVRGPE